MADSTTRTAARVLPLRTDLPAPVRTKRLRTAQIIHRLLLGLVLIIQVYPFLWLILTSVRAPEDFASSSPFGLPQSFTLDNFARAFEQGAVATYIANSAIVTIGSCALIVICGMTGAYAIQVLGFTGAGLVRGVFLTGIVVPVQIALVPLFIDYSRIGLLDTHLAIILPLAGFALPMSLFLFMSFFSYIPREIYEAASIDGAGPYRIFARITLPMSLNTVITVVMVNAIFIWNEFVFANTFVLSEGLKTIPLGLQNYIGNMGKTDWTATFAAVSVTVTPLLLAFLVLNKAMIYGLESGSTKG
ncbi:MULTISPECIES: carbohydrate ABC transporter permease [unclassified Actinomyces]|uniref:carbohydrate ABC transporter permease n=1 Tax=unclassified Actinomyces TaxID=2609248 RepID=UPI0020178C52|nr:MULTISPECIES: carbohydrate ABC transporter permease [unclassified Actinomyces]MCL3777913.1 carbohydrate ABC transporter permease [Actinomyces sp. AC-20-1]MCL3788793.1 carbohydrate ABC transporter permease [Actinomyces sp. 187325]MCL3791129.1 carbohydrate ABC transporter permease [Actinomyces sp. 186855]MCL3793690.1 carbohydrate ABC transporter permease [Actinomyces sp. 217892]